MQGILRWDLGSFSKLKGKQETEICSLLASDGEVPLSVLRRLLWERATFLFWFSLSLSLLWGGGGVVWGGRGDSRSRLYQSAVGISSDPNQVNIGSKSWANSAPGEVHMIHDIFFSFWAESVEATSNLSTRPICPPYRSTTRYPQDRVSLQLRALLNWALALYLLPAMVIAGSPV